MVKSIRSQKVTFATGIWFFTYDYITRSTNSKVINCPNRTKKFTKMVRFNKVYGALVKSCFSENLKGFPSSHVFYEKVKHVKKKQRSNTIETMWHWNTVWGSYYW